MTETITLNVTGMKCGGCENTVITKLSAIEGVADVRASSKDQQVSVAFDDGLTSVAAITETIINAGFTVAAA